jgi:hypothetical protein
MERLHNSAFRATQLRQPTNITKPEDRDETSPKRRLEPALHGTKSQKASPPDTAVKATEYKYHTNLAVKVQQ